MKFTRQAPALAEEPENERERGWPYGVRQSETARGRHLAQSPPGAGGFAGIPTGIAVGPFPFAIASGDFDGDGVADLMWQHDTQGTIVFWGMNSNNRLSNIIVDTVSNFDWGIVNLN